MDYPEIEYPDLPVSGRRDDIIAALKRNQVLILCGETGSGKTTQIPKMCLEAGLGEKGWIGCTQPRRIAARSVAQRVAEELKGELGGLVGYKVRFTDKVRRDTRIKFMTDGILLAESQGDAMLSQYSCIVVDEAHERSLNIDFLLGYLRTLIELRPDMKIVITSATIDAEKFSAHFGGAPVIEVSGRTYPVEIRYRPVGDDELAVAQTSTLTPTLSPQGRGSKAKKDEPDLTQAILDATDELSREGWGDTLIFLPGEREIRDVAEALRKHHPPQTEVLPLFARLSVEDQDKIFKPGNARRIVLSTNVAETSLTVPGIRYVIDTGQARVKRYSARNKVEQLLVEKISQASANQRAGRCGRVMDGICIRLYDEDDFSNRPRFTDPELLRSSLAGVILRMKSLGLGSVESFPFIDAPNTRFIADGYSLLQELNALDDRNELTELGKRIARLPLDPRMARMILAAERSGCLAEVLVIASFLSVQDPRERPQERAGSADEKHKLFADERSDFLGVVKLWNWFDEQIKHKKSNRQMREHLADHFLSSRRMREWRDVHGQLASQCGELGLRLNEKPAGYDALHQALLTGLLGNIGFRSDDAKASVKTGGRPGDGAYLGARGLRFGLHPASVLAKKGVKWVVAAELTDTGRLLGRMAAEVRPEWIEAAARHVIERSYSEPHWDRKSARVTAYERVTLYGVTLASRRRVHYGPIEPELSRELFIRGALVTGEYDVPHGWLKHNQELIAHIEELEHKARKSGVWLDEERIFAFFDKRIPQDMHNGPAFEKWLKVIKTDTLKLSREDIVAEGLDLSQGLYPEKLAIDGVDCAIKYRFEPGHPLDGATLSLPLYLLNRVTEAQLDWAIPGLLRDRVNALFKALPKDIRNSFIPLAQTVTAFLGEAQSGSQTLAQTVSGWVEKRAGKKVDAREADMDTHLKLNVRVLDDGGQELAMGRDLVALRKQLGETASLAYGGASEQDNEHERENIKAWDFGDLPPSVKFSRGGQKLTGYPALVDMGDSVAMKLMDSSALAEAESRKGVVRLMRMALSAQFKQLEKDLGKHTALALKFRGMYVPDVFFAELLDTIVERATLGDDELPRTQNEFDRQKERAKPRIAAVTQALLKSVEECIELYPQVQAKLAQKAFPHAQRDEQAHVATLVYAGFIRATPWERWQHLPRYLRAVLKRFDKLPAAGERDPRFMAVIHGIEKRYQERLAKHRKAGVIDPALAEFRWHIEELRVSLFAQELKTPYPVSAKRLEKFWEGVQP